MTDDHSTEPTDSADSPTLRGWKRWAFPLTAVVLVPLLLLGLLEAGLRLVGYGEPTGFFVPLDGVSEDGPDAVTTNSRFGRRFFPPEIARSPVVSRMARDKPDGTFRVFVLGGSAALGTPESAFGVGRVLEAMLRDAFPDREIEVVNAAMTAINSHVVLTIAEESDQYDPDLFVVYLGNNEVVGPYGPGTVFGGFSGSRWLIRTGIALQTTRIGQLARHTAAKLGGGGNDLGQWRGMEMFLDRAVPETDPRLDAVYSHLRANLHDVVDAGTDAGARVFLVSPAVRLTEPPFASVHRRDLTSANRDRFDQALARGQEHLDAGRSGDALEPLRDAVEIDEGYAEAQYLLGRTLLDLGREEDALEPLRRARDSDSLRFRADSQIQRIVRDVAREREADGVLFVDGTEVGYGEETFWEHVHFTFDGNVRLARAIYRRAAPLLGAATTPEPPTAEALAASLALTDWDRHRMAEEIFGMIRRPPFLDQTGHETRVADFRRRVSSLAVDAWRGRADAEASDRAVLARRPDDLPVREQLARLLEQTGRAEAAANEWEGLLERVPGVVAWQTRRAFALADAGRSDEAEVLLRHVVEKQPGAASWTNLGTVLQERNETREARELYERALTAEPGHEAARGNLAELHAQAGDFDRAEELIREGLERDPGSGRLHAQLAGLHERRGDLESAAEAWTRALEHDSENAVWQNNLGFVLDRLGRSVEASQSYLRAMESDPTFPLPYFNLADFALERGHPDRAIPLYRAGLELDPGNAQARRNLALAVEMLGS